MQDLRIMEENVFGEFFFKCTTHSYLLEKNETFNDE